MSSVTQLRAFHFVATAGGYSQAARGMAVSQSTLSSQVRDLEAASGVALFRRTPRGVTLTTEGDALYRITSRMFTSLDEARNFLKSHRSDAGRLRISADGASHTLPILSRLRLKRPELTFQMVVQNSDSVMEQMLQYQADVGITASPPSDERLYVKRLLRSAIGAIVPLTHPWAERDAIVMRDLEHQPFVLREQGSRTRTAFEQNLLVHDITLGPTFEISTREGMREAVATGFGIGVIAHIDFGYDSRLRYVPILDAAIMIDEYLACLHERRRQPMIADFFDCAAETFETFGEDNPQ